MADFPTRAIDIDTIIAKADAALPASSAALVATSGAYADFNRSTYFG